MEAKNTGGAAREAMLRLALERLRASRRRREEEDDVWFDEVFGEDETPKRPRNTLNRPGGRNALDEPIDYWGSMWGVMLRTQVRPMPRAPGRPRPRARANTLTVSGAGSLFEDGLRS